MNKKILFTTIIAIAITVGIASVFIANKKQVASLTPNSKTTESIPPAPVAKKPAQPVISQQNNKIKIAEQEGYYTNSELGIKFAYSSDDFKDKLIVQDNKIIYKDPINPDPNYIELFTKKDTQTIENAILDIVKNKGKDINNCKVINNGEYWANSKYSQYFLDLANPKISYSKQELEEIALADAEAKKDGGPFNGEWKKQEIYNKRLIENCSDYANPLGLGTSKTTPSQFIYNNKNKFVFLPGLINPSFYRDDSIELFNQ